MCLNFFMVSVLFCNLFSQSISLSNTHSYQLPDNSKVKSLNVTIYNEMSQQFQITIECYNYDSLKFFEVRSRGSNGFALHNGVLLELINCFNNATDNTNSNYRLARWFNSLPYFSTSFHEGYPITIKLNAYATVNSDALFKNFDFKKFDTMTFIKLGFKSTQFLNGLSCERCVFENNGNIDFNNFNESTVSETDTLQISFTKLSNINNENLKKFRELTTFDVSDFVLDDINAFNVPSLFKHIVNISGISIQNSKAKLIIHNQTFHGLKKLQRITLQGLQLEYIPNDMFKDLDALYSVFLASNNIKTVNPTVFQTNKILSFVSFENNPFFTEPHQKVTSFDMHGDFVVLTLGNFTVHTFDLLAQLVKNPNVSRVSFQSFLIDKFNINDFTKLYNERTSVIYLDFESSHPVLDLEYIKSVGNNIRSEHDLRDQLNIIINIGFAGDAMCHDRVMIKRLYPHFLRQYMTKPGFYFEANRLFIAFKIPESCTHLEEIFETTFLENCPTNCICKFNSLMEKVKIDCSYRNLTKIPHIPYPVQYKNLYSLDLNFENNSIVVLTLANQDDDVMRKLSTLNFKNNKIVALQINQTRLLINNVAINLCNNPILEAAYQLEVKFVSGSTFINRYNCATEDEFQRVVNFIQVHKSNELIERLNGFK